MKVMTNIKDLFKRSYYAYKLVKLRLFVFFSKSCYTKEIEANSADTLYIASPFFSYKNMYIIWEIWKVERYFVIILSGFWYETLSDDVFSRVGKAHDTPPVCLSRLASPRRAFSHFLNAGWISVWFAASRALYRFYIYKAVTHQLMRHCERGIML